MRRAANLAAILGLFLAAPLAVTAAVLSSVNATGTCSDNGPARHPQTGSSGEFVVSEGDTHNDTNGVQDISVKPICTGFLVDRVTDAAPASPGSPTCAAVGGGCTLRAAIDAANSLPGGDVICLPAGTYELTLGTNLVVSDDVTIEGESSLNTIIDGLKKTQIFDIQAGTTFLNNLQLTNGLRGGGCISACPPGTGSGGAVAVFGGGSLNAFGTDFNNNVAAFDGGAVWCAGVLKLSFCRFNGNQSSNEGGGLFLVDFSEGGINANAISDVEFYANKVGSKGKGGAIYIETNTQATISDLTAGGNDAPQGGGLYNAGNIMVTNSTISGNRNAGGPGVGFANGTVGIATLTNCTIASNSSGGLGFEIDQSGTMVSTLNSIVSGDPPRNCSGAVTSLGNNIESGTTCGFIELGDIQNTDPKLDPTLRYNGGFEQTHLLQPDSPAIDAGTNTGCPSADERGVARPQGARCDMGSVEMIPTVSIGSVSVVKPPSGTYVAAVFPVTLSFASSGTVQVFYTTADGTAKAGIDYQAAASILSIPPGVTSDSITVLVYGNTIASDDKMFTVQIYSPTGATIGTGVGTGTIHDLSGLPSLAIGDASVLAAATGTTPAVFTLTLSRASSRTVSVNYQTADGTATVADHDYLPVSGTVFFAPLETSKTVTVQVLGKGFGSVRTFFVDLSPAVNAAVTRSRGIGTITRRYPSLSVGDAAVQAPGVGATPGTAVLSVNLSIASAQTVMVSYATADRTATAGVDYTATSGTLSFAPGETTKPVSVPILPRDTVGPTKVFTLSLSGPTNALIAKSLGDCAIYDPSKPLPPGPFLFIDDVTVPRPSSSFAAYARLSVRLSGPSTVPISISYATKDGTAHAGVDYLATSGTLTIPTGETFQTILVPVLRVPSGGGNKTFQVSLAAPAFGDLIAAAEATVTIVGP